MLINVLFTLIYSFGYSFKSPLGLKENLNMPGTMNNFPVRTQQVAYTINGMHTELILSSYEDRIFVSVTQLGKLGTLVRGFQLFFNMAAVYHVIHSASRQMGVNVTPRNHVAQEEAVGGRPKLT